MNRVYRLFDVMIASGALLVAMPVLAIVAVALRLETPGPMIFRQQRLGMGKRPFTVYKLRTMCAEADPTVHREYVRQLVDGKERQQSDGGQNLYKLVADDRITRVGRVLRRLSLDEIPQLYNVLRGEMSIVGPRPVISYEAEIYPPAYDRRFQVRPGLTGLWQVSGRSTRTYHQMVMMDIEWVEQRSLRLYLSIVARTPRALLGRTAA